MTKQEALQKIAELPGDPEIAHAMADDILIAFLRDNDYSDLADAYVNAEDRIGFWYE